VHLSHGSVKAETDRKAKRSAELVSRADSMGEREGLTGADRVSGTAKRNPAVGVWLGGALKVTCMVPLGDDFSLWCNSGFSAVDNFGLVAFTVINCPPAKVEDGYFCPP
jgi:hypothetical protein